MTWLAFWTCLQELIAEPQLCMADTWLKRGGSIFKQKLAAQHLIKLTLQLFFFFFKWECCSVSSALKGIFSRDFSAFPCLLKRRVLFLFFPLLLHFLLLPVNVCYSITRKGKHVVRNPPRHWVFSSSTWQVLQVDPAPAWSFWTSGAVTALLAPSRSDQHLGNSASLILFLLGAEHLLRAVRACDTRCGGPGTHPVPSPLCHQGI